MGNKHGYDRCTVFDAILIIYSHNRDFSHEIEKSVRYSCYDNWNRLNAIYSSYQLVDKTEMSQDSKMSRDVTYSALLRDVKIETSGIVQF